VGHFPNVTHAQADRPRFDAGAKGLVRERLGPDVEVQWFVYNAGPSAMEGIMAGSIRCHLRRPQSSNQRAPQDAGKDIRIVAGACSGRGGTVVQPMGGSRRTRTFKGEGRDTAARQHARRAARAWLRSKGYKVTRGGDSCVVHTAIADPASLCTP